MTSAARAPAGTVPAKASVTKITVSNAWPTSVEPIVRVQSQRPRGRIFSLASTNELAKLKILTRGRWLWTRTDRKSTRLNSSHLGNSYAVLCLKKKIESKQQNKWAHV